MAEIAQDLDVLHRPVMLRKNEDWTGMMKVTLDDPAMPAGDEGIRQAGYLQLRARNSATTGVPVLPWPGSGRCIVAISPRSASAALDDFKPDLIVMWGDDQYENFKEDIVPPFAVLAYEDQDIQPWAHRRSPANPWNEPADKTFRVRGHREAGKYLASHLIRSRDRYRLRLQTVAQQNGPRVREHVAAAG